VDADQRGAGQLAQDPRVVEAECPYAHDADAYAAALHLRP
jgi:hypothetical protein